MKFAVYRDGLISALNRIIKVVPSTKVSPILTYILVDVHDNVVKLTATDLSNFISVTAPCKSGVDGIALFPGQDLLTALRTLNSSGVAFSFEDNVLKLRSEKTGWDWKTLDPNNFPPIPDWEKSKIYILDKDDLIDSMKKVKPAASRNSFSSNLEQLGFSNGLLQSGDGARFHQISLDSDIDVSFPLPFVDDLVSILPTLKEDKVEIGVTEDKSAVIVKCGDVHISTKTLQDKFPDLSKAFLLPSMTNYSHVRFSRKDFILSLKRVRISANKDSRAIKMTLSEDSTMTLESQQSNGTKAVDQIVVDCVPQSRDIILNVDHLMQALNMFDTELIEFKLGEDIKNKPSSVYIKDGRGTVVLNQLRSL